MATISENLQILKESTDAIKQAIIDKGGTISGDITTWASAINGISGGGNSSEEEYVFNGTLSYYMSEVIVTGRLNKIPDKGYLLVLCYNTGKVLANGYSINGTGPYTLTLDFEEPLMGTEIPAICILNNNYTNGTYTIIPVKFQEDNGTNPT